MDTIATLIEITAFDPISNLTVTGRITDRNDPRATTANGQEWLPLLAAAPSVGTSVFNGAFTGAGQIDLGDFVITLVDGLGDNFSRLVWDGADIKVYAGSLSDGVNYPLIFRAVGAGAQRRGRLELQVSLKTRASLLDVNVLTQSYAGSGNLEGDAGLKGTPKPWVFGAAKFCRPVLIDPVRQIYQVSAYGPVEGVTNVFEGGQEIPFENYTGNLSDFLTGPGPQGAKWWRYNQNGLIRMGRQPLYEMTCHVLGDTNAVVGGTALTKLGDIIGRIMSLTSTAPIKASSLAQVNQLVTAPFDDYLETQEQVTDVLTKMLLSVGGYYTFDENGNLIFGFIRFRTPTMTLDGLGRVDPPVIGISQLPTSAPVWYLRLGANQCHFVHDASDMPAIIADQAKAIDDAQKTADSKNKTFPPSSAPPVGAIDGDQWPDTSASPTTMRRFNSTLGTWVATSNQITAAVQVPYANGETIESLKPSQIGSDKTSSNISSGISGQGDFATLSKIFFGSQYLLETNGGAQATLNAFKTSLGQAASLFNQGAFATLSSAAYGSSLLTGFGLLSPLNNLLLGGNFLFQSNGSTKVTDSTAITSLGVAASIASQGTLATLSTLSRTGGQLTGFGAMAGLANFNLGSTYLRRADGTTLVTDATAITSLGQAASIASQGSLATLSSLANGSSFLTGFGGLSGLSNVFFGSPQILETIGGAQATLGNFKTNQGVAASITGQGGLATQNTISVDSQLSGNIALRLTPFADDLRFLQAGRIAWTGGDTVQNYKPQEGGANITENRSAASFTGQTAWATLTQSTTKLNYLQADGAMRLGFGAGLLNESGSGWLSDSGVITSLGTASAISGQGALATRATVDDGYLSGNLASRIAPWPSDARYLNANTVAWNEGNTVQNLKPLEAGANVTESRTAAAITGQGYGATASRSLVDNTYVPAGNNALANSDQSLRVSWINSYNPNVIDGMSATYAKNTWPASAYSYTLSGKTQNVYVQQGAPTTGTADGAGDLAVASDFTMADENGSRLEVTCSPGDRVIFSLYVAAHRCKSTLYIGFYNASGVALEFPGIGTVEPTEDNTATLDRYRRPSVVAIAPPNTAFCCVFIRKYNTQGGSPNSFLWWAAPMLERATTNQEAPSPYISGPIRAVKDGGFSGELDADKTSGKQAASIAGQGGLATQNAISVDEQLAGNMAQRLAPFSGDPRYLAAGRVAWAGGDVVEALKPQEAGSNVTENRTASSITAQGGLATRSSVSLGFGGGMVSEQGAYWLTNANTITSAGVASGINNQGTFATTSSISRTDVASFFNFNAFSLNYSITRSDGVSTVTEALAITSLGISSGFVGQAIGATSNSLADLDPVQNSKLNGLVTGGRSAASYGETIKKVLAPGASVTIEAYVNRAAGGANGYFTAQVMAGPVGGAVSIAGVGNESYVGVSEPGTSYLVNVVFTNNTNIRQTFAFYLTDTRTNGNAGGPVIPATTYLLV